MLASPWRLCPSSQRCYGGTIHLGGQRELKGACAGCNGCAVRGATGCGFARAASSDSECGDAAGSLQPWAPRPISIGSVGRRPELAEQREERLEGFRRACRWAKRESRAQVWGRARGRMCWPSDEPGVVGPGERRARARRPGAGETSSPSSTVSGLGTITNCGLNKMRFCESFIEHQRMPFVHCSPVRRHSSAQGADSSRIRLPSHAGPS